MRSSATRSHRQKRATPWKASFSASGSRASLVGSHELYFGYAISRRLLYTLDMGHYHPTESVADKLSAVLGFLPEVLLHVSRGVRWDSDHVVVLNDELSALAQQLVRGRFLPRTHLGLDYFDASINRVAAWVIGCRNLIKALLAAMLEPVDRLRAAEAAGDFTRRLALLEDSKMLPFGPVWDYYCATLRRPASRGLVRRGAQIRARCSCSAALTACARSPMRRLLAGALILSWIACGTGPAAAQFQTPQVFAGAPAALWIFPPGAAGNEFGVFHFRRAFELDAKPSSFVVHVSADNRYRLFVNGEQMSSGPQRSDLMHWRYETVDLAPHLRVGRNVLAALVWNWGVEKPVAQFSRQTAFLLQGDSPREAVVNSGPEWKVLRNEGYAPIPVRGEATGGYYASPPGEAIDARRYPWGWTQLDFSEEGWVAATAGEGFRARRTQLRGPATPSAKPVAGSSWLARSLRWRRRRYGSLLCGGVRASSPMRASSEERATLSCLQRPGRWSCWTSNTSPTRSPCSRPVAARAAP